MSSSSQPLPAPAARPSTLLHWLNRVAPVYPGEQGVAWLCFTVNFLMFAGIMLGRNARDSLFLTYVGVEYLPYMYFANAVFLVVCSAVYTSLVDRLDRGRFLGGTSLLFAASLVFSRIMLRGQPRWFLSVLYIQAQVVWYFSLMLFWTFAGELFETRQAKRLFPLFGLGALLGMVGVGAASKTLVHALGTPNLLLVWSGLILAALVTGATAYRRYWKAKPAALDVMAFSKHRPSQWQVLREGFREVGGEPLLRSMAGYTLLLWTVYAVVDFCFNKTMRARYADPNALTAFFCMFAGAQGLLSLVVQLYLTRPAIARLGVGATIDFHPAVLVIGTASMSLGYGYGSVLATKLGDATMLYTLSDSSYQLLYNPIPPDRRAHVRGFIEGYIKPASLIGAGALVLIGDRYLKPINLFGRSISNVQQLSWAAFAMAAVWLTVASGAKKGYLGALLNNLRAASPSLRHAAAVALAGLKDAATKSALLKALKGGRPELVIAALQFSRALDDRDAAATASDLLGHPDPRVRATAASALGRLGDAQVEVSLMALLSDADARVRANAIEALTATGQGSSKTGLAEKLRSFLQDPSRRVRANAVVALARITGNPSSPELLATVRDLVRGSSDDRATAAYALGQLSGEPYAGLAAELLNDNEPSVRVSAARALGRMGTARSIPALVEALGGLPQLRHEARRSIAAISRRNDRDVAQADIAGELVKTVLTSGRAEIRSELADVLGRLPAEPEVDRSQILDALIALLRDPEWRVRWKALKALERLARLAPLAERVRGVLIECARAELAHIRQDMACSSALARSASSGTETEQAQHAAHALVRALQEDQARAEDRLLRVLGVLSNPEATREIKEKLRSDDPRLRSDALEALDTLAPKEISQDVISLLDPEPGSAISPELSLGQVIATLMRHPKPWLRALTAYYLGYHPQLLAQLDDERSLESLLQDKDSLVRETALYAGWQGFGPNWEERVKHAIASGDSALQRAAQRIQAESGLHSVPVSAPRERAPAPTAGVQQAEGRKRPMLTVEKVLFLKSAPLFAGLDSEELAALAEVAFEQEYKSGEVIFEHNRIPKHLYVIVRGKVEVYYRSGEAERLIAVLGAEENFGEMALLDDEPRPRSASVRAVEPTLVLKIDRDNFRELILERPQIAFAIFKILIQRLRQRDLEAHEVGSLSAGRHYA